MNYDRLYDDSLHKALADYFYLMNRGYPEKGSLKLTGDRYKLSTDMRTLLYRGVTSREKSLKRNSRLVDKPEKLLIIDGYNVLFTLLNYRLGRLVFVSADNICRDNGSLFGKIRNEKYFIECTCIMAEYIQNFSNLEVILYLDEPVSFSRNHQQIIEEEFKKLEIKAKTKVVHSADQAVLMHTSGTIATSDSNVLDHSTNPVVDIPRKILESKFHAMLFNLYGLLIGGRED